MAHQGCLFDWVISCVPLVVWWMFRGAATVYVAEGPRPAWCGNGRLELLRWVGGGQHDIAAWGLGRRQQQREVGGGGQRVVWWWPCPAMMPATWGLERLRVTSWASQGGQQDGLLGDSRTGRELLQLGAMRNRQGQQPAASSTTTQRNASQRNGQRGTAASARGMPSVQPAGVLTDSRRSRRPCCCQSPVTCTCTMAPLVDSCSPPPPRLASFWPPA